MTEKTRLVASLKNGTVIDHIPAGQGWNIVRLLKFHKRKVPMSVGLNLKSRRGGLKDVIRIENVTLTDLDAHEIAIFAPGCTLSTIKNHSIEKKISATLPKTVRAHLRCPNTACISRHEPVTSQFSVKSHKAKIYLTCHYCEK
ncbi:MAG: aspartate carbamoyltransferase regulatory subunit, partial [Simkaniaceae bacterium]|nr:aspartate carbamoyltransferase regulatory subunit [Simkaniaceae bacterium]